MKTNAFNYFVLVTVLSVLPVADTVEAQQRGRGRRGRMPTRQSEAFGSQTGGGVNVSAVSERQRAVLSGMMDEEKLAHDVYVMFARTSRSQIFGNIADAESRHMNALKQIAVRYRLNVPATNNAVGRFSNPAVTKLYQKLVAAGSQSPLDAFKVGAKIEEMDIADLTVAISVSPQPDIQRVLANLQRGSRNHLRAFAGAIREAGGDYVAEYLSQEEFNRIANSSFEKGGQGHGAEGGRRNASGNVSGRQNRNQ